MHFVNRAAHALRGYAVPAALNLTINSIVIVVVICWYWLRARLNLWGGVTTISFSLMALRSYQTYRPLRPNVATTIGIAPRLPQISHPQHITKGILSPHQAFTGTNGTTSRMISSAVSSSVPSQVIIQRISSRYVVVSGNNNNGHNNVGMDGTILAPTATSNGTIDLSRDAYSPAPP
jgi:hypothetical protein